MKRRTKPRYRQFRHYEGRMTVVVRARTKMARQFSSPISWWVEIK